MPELPEVEITRRKLLPLLRGRRILDFWTNWVRGLRIAKSKEQIVKSIRGRKILDVARRGKVLVFRLSGEPERMLAIHLRMSGRLEVVPLLSSWSSSPKWVHFRWRLSGGKELRFVDPRKFGIVWYGAPEKLNRDPYLARLGLEADAMTFGQFSEVLADARGMIKPFLLRQDKFAGIGNIIADEALWRARIHPETRITYLDARVRRRLYQGIRKTIRAMLSSGGTTLRNWRTPDGSAGRFQEKRLVHGRAGQPCPRCRTILKRIVVGGRGTTVCPRCQPR